MKLLLTIAATSMLVAIQQNTPQKSTEKKTEAKSITTKGDGNKAGEKVTMIEYLSETGEHRIATIVAVATKDKKETNLMWKTRNVMNNDWAAPTAWLDYKGHDGKLRATKIHATVNASNKENLGYEFDVITRGNDGGTEEKHHAAMGFQGYNGDLWWLGNIVVYESGEVGFILKKAEAAKK